MGAARHGWPGAKHHPAFWLSTWFGAGLLRPAPGTWGSLAALPFAYALIYAGGWVLLGMAAVVIFALGIWAAARYTAASARPDASEIVIDEVAGQWLALIPVAYWAPNWIVAWLAAFLLFRLFDVAKPWPIALIDRRTKGGLGVMLDDVVAGLFTAAMIAGYFLL